MTTTAQTQKDTLFYIKRITGFILLLILSAVFLFSAYSKSGVVFMHGRLMDSPDGFDSFQWTFLGLGINSVLLAGIIARIFIAIEWMLGIFLLFHIFLKQFTYRAVIILLSLFII